MSFEKLGLGSAFERGDSDRPEVRSEIHENWLAMQAAYREYKRISEELESAYRSMDGSSTMEQVGLALLDTQQRAAFEQYLEARLAYLESRFDETLRPPAPQVLIEREPPSGFVSWLMTASQKPVLQILAVLLLCTTAFSLVRQQKHVRELEAARDENRTALFQTRQALQMLGQKLEVMGPSQHPPVQQIVHTPATAAHETTQPAPPRKKQVQTAGSRSENIFSLTPSRQFRRVGPIEISVRSVDVQRKNVSLWIASGHFTSAVQLRQNQLAWIKLNDQRKLVGLVIDRVTSSRLDGHLIGPRPERQELSQLRQMFPASP
jgi:hypothetical protein